MTCANWMITVLSAIVLIFTFWPGMLGATVSEWIIIISTLLIILVVWTGCNCKYCGKTIKSKKK